MSEEFERRAIAESLVRAHGVVNPFPSAQLRMKRLHVPAIGDDLIELFVMCAVSPFDLSIQLRRTGRQDEQRQATLLTEVVQILPPPLTIEGLPGDSKMPGR